MNILDFALVLKKSLIKLFGEENVLKLSNRPTGQEKNKFIFTILVNSKKFNGFIYFNKNLIVKDIRNILFAFKRNCFEALKKEKPNVSDTPNEKGSTSLD